jgi:uncharacterized protein YndB with AHSA1/START domain
MAQASEAKLKEGGPPPLKLSRLFHAPRKTLFEAWGSSEAVKRWFCPETYTAPYASVELRVGGAFDVCMRSPTGEEHWVRGLFTEVAPHDRLVIDMQCMGADGAALFRAYTELEFADAPCGARLDVTQTYTMIDLSKEWMVTGAPDGWRSTLDKLEREVIGRQGGGEMQGRSAVHGLFSLIRRFEAPIARVWRALTDEQAKSQWFAGTPDKWTLIERRMDVRLGGVERLKGRWEGGVVSTFDAIYHDVVPNERLIYTYVMYLDEKKISVSLATMALKAEGGATVLTLTEQGVFLDGYDDAGSRERGTGFLLDALAASLRD